jgi:hypothetical protein
VAVVIVVVGKADVETVEAEVAAEPVDELD